MAALALRKRQGGPWAWLIRRWTRSEYDHCEIIVGKDWHSSLFWAGGVRRVSEQPKGEWDFVSLPWVDDEEVRAYYEATQHDGYDWLAIFGQVFRGRWQLANAAMCSEWCASVMGLPQPDAYDPGLLGQVAQWANRIWSEK